MVALLITQATDVQAQQREDAAASERDKPAPARPAAYEPWNQADQKNFDWIQLTNGEWLKGELKGMREDMLSFDSDEFELQELDWEDVKVVYSRQRYTYVFDDQSILTGPALITGDELVVDTSSGKKAVDRSRIFSIVRAGRHEIEHWRFKLSVGVTARRGNTQSVDYTAYSRLRREDALRRLTLQYDGAFGIVSGERNTNKHRGDAEWVLFLSPRFYLTPLLGEVLHDEFQNIKFRWIAATGGGLHLIDTSDVALDFQLGAGYAQSYFISTLPGDSSPVGGFLTIPTLALDWDITDDLELELSWYSAVFIPNFENTFHHGTVRLSLDVTDVIDVSFSTIFDRLEDPTPSEDGTIPYKSDLAMTASIGIDLE